MSEEGQKEIENSFVIAKEVPFNDREKSLIASNLLTVSQVYELRGLRQAALVFERRSPANGLSRGGLWNNLKAELMGQYRQLCVHCEATYSDFVKRLIAQGLIKELEVVGMVRRPWKFDDSHVALQLKTKDQKAFVLDAWHENGGNAPHIVTLEDWFQENDRADVAALIGQ
jgi:hypothetical protein